MKKINSITVIAGDYPAQGHAMLVFVQQLVHAIIDVEIKVSVVAPQSIVHKIVHKEKFFPIHSKGVTETGITYDIYRPYTLSFGNRHCFKRFTGWFNKRSIVIILR